MRRIVWIAPWLVAACFSCTDRGDTVTQPEAVRADIVREDAGVISSFYDSENPYTVQRVNEAGEQTVVRAAVGHFESLGYTAAPEYSFIAAGTDPDGRQVEITAVAMSHASETTPETTTDAVYVFYVRGDEYETVVPLRVSFDDDPPDEGSHRIGDGVWLSLADESFGPDELAAAARFHWSPWLRCVAERIAAGGASCAMSCRFTFNLYLHCLAKCTAGYAVYAFVYCAFIQL
jgi:hypothetical protein